MISLYHNLPASQTANALTGHYSKLAISTQRLSSGLRINGAADDAAGLAIRELQRADIAALQQGARNVNDAISMLQTFDGALGVIDEKLIRMKELAEQAATGTYNSTQRLMIDSEFQAMGSEIDRIANATDFNGVKLLCTKLMTWYEDEDKFFITDQGSIANQNFNPNGNNRNITITPSVNAGRYVNANTTAKTISVELNVGFKPVTTSGNMDVISVNGTETRYRLGSTDFDVAYVNALGNADGPIMNYATNPPPSSPGDPTRVSGWTIKDNNQNYTIFPPGAGDTQLMAMGPNPQSSIFFSLEKAGNPVSPLAIDSDITDITVNTGNGTYSITKNVLDVTKGQGSGQEVGAVRYDPNTNSITVALNNGGGSVSLSLDGAPANGDIITFDINMEGEVKTVPVEHHGVDPNQKVKIHFGTMNDSAEDYYYIRYANCTREGLGISDVGIQTQQDAQEALVRVDDAIVQKDKIRAEFGAMQNRLENTMTNLKVQAENLQAAESRISDTDIAMEMMNFVKNQILTQSAVAMLSQANSMPQMVLRLIS